MEEQRFWVSLLAITIFVGPGLGILMGVYVTNLRAKRKFERVMQQLRNLMSQEAQTLILDALQTQAYAHTTDSKLDAAQKETVLNLIPPKIEELRAKGVSLSDLESLAVVYQLIKQPNGLRATKQPG